MVHRLTGQKKIEDEYSDSYVLPKVNKVNMTGMIEAIGEYIGSHYGVEKVSLTYTVRKTVDSQ